MPKRKPVEAAEPAPAVVEPKKKTVRSTAAAKPRSTSNTVAHKHHAKKTTADTVNSNETPAVPFTASSTTAISHDDIALLAYSYWEARGFQGGSPEQDWFRAETELLKLAQNR
jgi:hypothetical protein